MISILNLPDGQMKTLGEFKLQKNCNHSSRIFFGLVKMAFGLLRASYSLPEWQAAKLTLFAPWNLLEKLNGKHCVT